jgi:hypothetical protein
MITLPAELTREGVAALSAANQLEARQHLPLAVRRALARHLQPLEDEARRLNLSQIALSVLKRSVVKTMFEAGAAYARWDSAMWVSAARRSQTHFAAVLCVAHRLGCLPAMEAVAAGIEPTSFARPSIRS